MSEKIVIEEELALEESPAENATPVSLFRKFIKAENMTLSKNLILPRK